MNEIAEYIKHTIECAENKSVVIKDYYALDKYLVDCGSFIALRQICAKFGRSVSSEWGLTPSQLKSKPVSARRLPKAKVKIDKKLARVIKAKAKVKAVVAKKAKASPKKAKPNPKKTHKHRS